MTNPIPSEPAPLKPLPKRQGIAFRDAILPGLAIASGTLVGFAAPDLIEADGALDIAKCVLLGLSGGAVSYAVNILAIEKGAPLAAIGSIGAGLASTVSMIAVGAGLWAATYAGLTIAETDRLRLEDFGRDQAVFIERRIGIAQQAGRLRAVLASITADLAAKTDCERKSSCISRNGSGGEGDVFFALQGELQKARAVAGEIERGATVSKATTVRLLDLQKAVIYVSVPPPQPVYDIP